MSVLKESTIHDKEAAVKQAKERLQAAADQYLGLGKEALLIELMKQEMNRATRVGQYGDLWLEHPMPSMSDPAKKVCWLTNLGDYDEAHAARLYLKASLHAVDRFFILESGSRGRTIAVESDYVPLMLSESTLVA